MIHLLQVSPEYSIKDLKKLARRYAMTGGYEVELEPGLTIEQLVQLAEIHIPELENYQKGSSTYRSNTSFRVLELISNNASIPAELHDKIKQVISHT